MKNVRKIILLVISLFIFVATTIITINGVFNGASAGQVGDSIKGMGQCNMEEACCSTQANYGLFDLIKEHGSTKNVVCGHDHGNDFSLMYQGVRLTYALKTGNGAYWMGADRSGYTEITINSTGNASVNHVYYNPTL